MKSIYSWLVLIVSITVFISSCKSSDDSSTTTSSGLFIAVGGSGTLLTSSDGTTWTAQTTGTTNALYGVTFGE